VRLYRRGGERLPTGVDGPWSWPPYAPVRRLTPAAPRAVTVAPAWGVSCAPPRAGPFGRPGPWAEEVHEIEAAYGPARTAHVSLEEFARTLTPTEETVERLREGGVRARELPARLARARAAGEVETFREAFRRFRAFDRPNVLHLFATFRYAPGFARAFPEAVQTGPLWPGLGRRGARPPRRTGGWVWYASPASAEAIADAVVDGLGRARHAPSLFVRSPRPWRSFPARPSVLLRTAPVPRSAWSRQLANASLRIVTGSRTLLEALEAGGPFLYFNGVLGRGAARRRHRPEKLRALLAVARAEGWPADLVRDLDDFSRGRRVAPIAARAADRLGGWGDVPRRPRARGFAPGFEAAAPVLVRFVQEFAGGAEGAEALVARFRRASHP